MTDLSDAIDRLTNEGFAIRYDEVTDEISGGTEISRLNSGIEGLANSFSIVRRDNGWVTNKMSGFLQIHIEKPTLSEAADVVCKLYAKIEQFDDVSMNTETALEALAKAGLVGEFIQKLSSIMICSREVSGECVEGISIARIGSYFVTVRFGDRPAPIAINYSETLVEAVESLILIQKSA